MQSQTKIFAHLVSDYLRPAPVVLSSDDTIAHLIAQLTEYKTTFALVTDGGGRLVGIFTEQDVTRRIALRCTGDERLGEVMTTPVHAIRATDYIYFAIAKMRRFGWRHMPVVDRKRRPVGMIRLVDALAVAAEQTVELIERVSHEGTLEGLSEIKAVQVEVADELFADHVPAPEIQALITHINRDIHRRVITMHLDKMAEEGWGEPPVSFCAIIMGSGGRGENFLYPDQDNGFILDDYPDAAHNEIDGFFMELADRMNRSLNAIGFPFCKGYVMAINPLWRKTRSQWQKQVTTWVKRKSFVAVRLSDIFFDFNVVYGDPDMSHELRNLVTKIMQRKSSLSFLQEIQRESGEQGVALGWFGRFITEKEVKQHKGKINLKHTGTLPLVHNVRMLALREGVASTGTLDRIAALQVKGMFDQDEQDYLAGAFEHITGLLLRQQIRDFKAGKKVNNFVHPKAMSKRERDILTSSLRAIDKLRGRVRSEFLADIF
jgi:signal-transduction protein with cAMP-binding, CBS, and nucleotidyltransferase domain